MTENKQEYRELRNILASRHNSLSSELAHLEFLITWVDKRTGRKKPNYSATDYYCLGAQECTFPDDKHSKHPRG